MITLNKLLPFAYIIITLSLLAVIIVCYMNKSENFQNQIYKSHCNGLFGCCGEGEDPYAIIGGIAPSVPYQYSAYIQPNCCMCKNRLGDQDQDNGEFCNLNDKSRSKRKNRRRRRKNRFIKGVF